MGAMICYLTSLLVQDPTAGAISRCLLPSIGIKETQLIRYLQLKISRKAIKLGYRVYQGKLTRANEKPILAYFYVKAGVRRLSKIEIFVDEQQQCQRYETDLRRLRGRENDAEWGTRAYEISWKAKYDLPAVSFWLFAYDGLNAHCLITFGSTGR